MPHVPVEVEKSTNIVAGPKRCRGVMEGVEVHNYMYQVSATNSLSPSLHIIALSFSLSLT